jgi:hypothetical protein
MQGLECFLIFFVFLAIVIGAAVYNQTVTQPKLNEAWQTAARDLGLQFTPGDWLRSRCLTGTYRGNSVTVDVYRTGGKNSQTFTRYTVYYPQPLRLGLNLQRRGFFSGLWHLLGGQDIQVGDEAFDTELVVKGRDPDAVIAFLTPRRREEALALLLQFPGSAVEDDKIRCQSHGEQGDPGEIVRTVRRLCAAAGVLTNGAEEEAGDLPEGGETEEVPEVLPAAPPGPPPARQLAAEAPPAFPPPPAPPPPIPEQAPPPPPPPPSPWETAAAPATTGGLTPLRSPPAGGDPALDVAAVCRALFQSDLMTYRIAEVFDRQYKDAVVCWAGVVQEVSSVFFDLPFSSLTGTRAAFLVYEVPGVFGSKVQAVVQLPAGLEGSLRGRLGERLTFTGRLVACDAFVRRLFVAGGQLV